MSGGALALRELEPIAVGGRRLVFAHPRDPSLCVKALRLDEDRYGKKDRKKILPVWLRREYDNNADEARVLRALERRLGERFDHMPRFRGWVETDMGRALLVDMIRDHDGGISRTLREAVVRGADVERIREAWERFAAYCLEHRLATRALLDHNIVAQDLAGGRWRIVLVDGLGDRSAVPIGSLLPPLARAKIEASLQRCWARVEALKDGAGLRRDWDTSRWGQGFLIHRDDRDAVARATER